MITSHDLENRLAAVMYHLNTAQSNMMAFGDTRLGEDALASIKAAKDQLYAIDGQIKPGDLLSEVG